MNDDPAFGRAIQEFLEDGSDRTPPAAIDAVLLAVRTTPQDRDLRIPWRTAPMPNPMRLVAAIAVIVVAGVAAFNLFGSSSGVGGVSSPSPTVAPSASAPTPSPQPSIAPIDTTTWPNYTSDRYGFRIGHPAEWTNVTPADHSWTTPTDSDAGAGGTDEFVDPAGQVRVSAWSVAVQPGTSAEAWIQTYCQEYTKPCSGIPARAVGESIDGHAGLLVPFTNDLEAFFLIDDRMYVVAVWRPDQDQSVAAYGGAQRLLDGFVSTMHLLPGGPAPSATTPRPS